MKSTKELYPAKNLIDNNYDNFAHTSEAYNTDGTWIRAKLSLLCTVKQIKIYNRKIEFQYRIVGLSIYMKRDDTIVTACGTIENVKSVYTIECLGVGNIIELSKKGDVRNRTQNIAEIEAFGTLSGIFDIFY